MARLGDVVLYRLDDSDTAVIRSRRRTSGLRGPSVHPGQLVAVVVTSIDGGLLYGRGFLDCSLDELLVNGASRGDQPGCWQPKT